MTALSTVCGTWLSRNSCLTFPQLAFVRMWLNMETNCCETVEMNNPFTPKIWEIILPTDDHTFLCWLASPENLVLYQDNNSLIDNFLNSHYLSAWQGIKIIRRITYWSLLGFKWLTGRLASELALVGWFMVEWTNHVYQHDSRDTIWPWSCNSGKFTYMYM